MTFTRNIALLSGRTVLGSYLAGHGAQKLFGSFGGPGIEAASAGFERIGLRPGAFFARLAGTSELVGGALTALGALSPLGPVTLAATMAVASTTHRANGPFSTKGGFELPLTNLAAALALAVSGPGTFSADRLTGARLSRSTTRLLVLGALASSAFSIRMLLRNSAPPPGPAKSEPPGGTTASPEQGS